MGGEARTVHICNVPLAALVTSMHLFHKSFSEHMFNGCLLCGIRYGFAQQQTGTKCLLATGLGGVLLW